MYIAILWAEKVIVEHILCIQEIKQRYLNDDNLLWRLMYLLFAQRTNKETREYVLSEFKEVKGKLTECIGKRYPGSDGKYGKNAYSFDKYSIVGMMTFNGYLKKLEELILYVGESVIKDGVFLKDQWGDNAIQGAIEGKKLDVIKFIMRINGVKQRCLDDQDELHGIVNKLNTNFDESICKYMINELNLTKEKITKLKEYKDFDPSQILTLL